MDLKENIKFPIVFRFPPFARYFTLSLSVLVITYAMFYLFTEVTAETRTLLKVLPFVIMFFASDSLSRNLLSLNKITMTEQYLIFSHLAKKNVQIAWADIVKLECYVGKGKYFMISFKVGEEIKKYLFPMAFRNILDVISLIKILAPHTETDEFVGSLIFAPKKEA